MFLPLVTINVKSPLITASPSWRAWMNFLNSFTFSHLQARWSPFTLNELSLLCVVRKYTHTTCSQTRLLTDGQSFPPNIILRRTHSDTGHHILFLNDPRQNWDYMHANCEVPGSQWLGQTYSKARTMRRRWYTNNQLTKPLTLTLTT